MNPIQSLVQIHRVFGVCDPVPGPRHEFYHRGWNNYRRLVNKNDMNIKNRDRVLKTTEIPTCFLNSSRSGSGGPSSINMFLIDHAFFLLSQTDSKTTTSPTQPYPQSQSYLNLLLSKTCQDSSDSRIQNSYQGKYSNPHTRCLSFLTSAPR